MKTRTGISIGVLAFAAGLAAGNLPSVVASAGSPDDLATRKFSVFVDEVKGNLVFGDEFSGQYSKTFTLSDGSKRTIELKPMVHKGMQVVRLKDNGGVTYMGLNGRATNGKLMIQVDDEREVMRQLKEQGWKLPEKK